MDLGTFNLFLKLIKEEYRLTDGQILKLTRRLLADEQEFERLWDIYKHKTVMSGVDDFRPYLHELLT